MILIKIEDSHIRADGFDPITNTVYEFYGDYWHGNPFIYNQNDINKVNKKSFGQLYKETRNREKEFKKSPTLFKDKL